MLHHIETRQKIIVMAAVMSGLFLVTLDQTIVSTALARIVEDFDSFSSLTLIVTSYLLASTVTVPIAGKLSDIFGRRIMLMIGVALFTVMSLMSGLAGTIEQLIIFRGIQGVGGGIVMANAFTIVGDLFSPRERGKWQGLIGAVFGLSAIIGPLLGGYLADPHSVLGLTTNWRWAFWINVPIGIVAFLVIAKYCPVIRYDHKPHIDYWGAGLLAVALSSVILAVDSTESIFSGLVAHGLAVGVIKGALWATAVFATALFVLAERHAPEPIIPLDFFKNYTFRVIMFVAFLFGAGFLATVLYLTQFNIQVFNATATDAGLMLLPMIAGLTITSALTGQIVSRTGKYKTLLLSGFLLAAISVFMLSRLTPASPYWHEALIITVAGIGLGTGMPIISLMVQNEFAQRDLGAATACSQLFRGLGSTVGTAVLGGILTTGVLSGLGSVYMDPYVQALDRQTITSYVKDNATNADIVLNLNTPEARERLYTEFNVSLDGSLEQESDKNIIRQQFLENQAAFGQKTERVFSNSLRTVFYISAALMALATIGVFFIKEKPLRDKSPSVE